jgi:hypothetical protein
MMLEVVKVKPDNNIKFMLKYLIDKYGDRAELGDKS